jgi:hypothetical protein
MKKIFLVIPMIALVAWSCQKPAQEQTASQDQAQTPAQAEISTAGWKTYTNSALGFKFSYPPEYVIEENPKDLPIPEDNPDYYKGTLVYLSNQNATSGPDSVMKPGEVYGQIYILARKSSLKQQFSDGFSVFLRRAEEIMGSNNQNSYWMLSYFSGDANSSNRTYLLSDHEPTSPADDGSAPSNILMARVQSSYNGDIIPDVTVPDMIARSLQFTK